VNWNGHGYEFATDVVGNAATLGEKDINKYLHVLRPKVADRLGEFRSRLIGAISSFTVFPNFSFLPGRTPCASGSRATRTRSSCSPG
jgi:ethylbenzene dioxygenase alpha subunit